MNLLKMQNLIYRYGFDSSDPVTDVLNASMHEIETEFDWPFLEVSTSFAQPAGSSVLPLSTDFVKLIYLKDLSNLRKLKYWDVRRFERDIADQTEVGYPEVYTIRGAGANTFIQLWRVPSSTVTFDLLYQAATPDMVNPSDAPTVGGAYQWPVVMHMPIVFRAASVLLQMENEEDRAKTAQDQYMSALRGCMARFAERELDEPDSVQDTQGYGSSSVASVGY